MLGRLLTTIALLGVVPFAGADSVQGEALGADLGDTSVGEWHVYWLATGGGATTLSLTWVTSVFPFADLDLRLYRPGALDDGALTDDELMADSSQRGGAHESITHGLAGGQYVVAVVAWQAQNERYTLTSSSGDLEVAASTVGIQSE